MKEPERKCILLSTHEAKQTASLSMMKTLAEGGSVTNGGEKERAIKKKTGKKEKRKKERKKEKRKQLSPFLLRGERKGEKEMKEQKREKRIIYSFFLAFPTLPNNSGVDFFPHPL